MADQRPTVGPRAVMPGSLIDSVPLSTGWKKPQALRDSLNAGLMVLTRPKEGYLDVRLKLHKLGINQFDILPHKIFPCLTLLFSTAFLCR